MLTRWKIVLGLSGWLASMVGLALWMSWHNPPSQPQYSVSHQSTKSERAPRSAEERIADYTWWLGFFTAVLGTVAIVQIVFLIRADKSAARQMRLMRANANRQSYDTREAIRVTVENAERQADDTRILQRAYVAVEPRGIIPLETQPHTVAHIAIKNVGHLPARSLRWLIEAKTDSDGQLNGFPIDESRLVGDNVLSIGNEMLESKNDALSTRDTENIRGSGLYYYVWGIVRYDDGFGIPRYTRFCHRYSGAGYRRFKDGINAGKDALVAEYARYHQYGNDAD